MGGPFRPPGAGFRPSGSSGDVVGDMSVTGTLTADTVVVTSNLVAADVSVTGDMSMSSPTGVLTVPDGTLAQPSIVFDGAQTTGFYRPAAGEIGFGVATVLAAVMKAAGSVFALPVELPAGTLAAPSLRFTGSNVGSGFSMASADTLIYGRAGSNHLQSSASLITCFTNMTVAGSMLHSAGMRNTGAAAKTTDYVMLATDNQVIAGSGCGNVTLPASPATFQRYEIWNRSGGAVNLVRGSGQTINGVAANPSIADGACVIAQLVTGSTDWQACEAPAA